MTDSGIMSSWSMSIVGDVPYDKKSSPPALRCRARKVRKNNCHKPSVYIPIFEGFLAQPDMYLDWELQVDDIFAHHFHEHNQVWAAVSSFAEYASTWWDEYCDLYPDYIPTTWPDLKLAMRYKFVPSSYTRKMLHKLENLEQGSDTVEEYYNALKITLFRCDLEESEESFMDRFWDGLNHDIQDLIMLEKYYSIDRMFLLACKAEQKIKRRVHGTIKCKKRWIFMRHRQV